MRLHGGTVKFPQLATPSSPFARRAEIYPSQARLITDIKAASRLLLPACNKDLLLGPSCASAIVKQNMYEDPCATAVKT